MRKHTAPLYVLFAAVILLASGLGCKKNGFLDATVTTNLDSTSVFSDSTKAIAFLNNIYTKVGFASDPRRFSGGSYAAGLDAACDEAEGPNASSSNGFTMFATGTVSPTVVPTDAWGTPYGMIRAVNQFLGHLSIIPFNQALKTETKAEARFLRAWYYFIMLEHYGGVPLIGDTVYAAADQIPAVRETLGKLAAWEASLAGMIMGQIQAAEEWPSEGFYCFNRRFVYAALNWCTENNSTIIDQIRELSGGSVFQMPADISVMNDPALKEEFLKYWASPQLPAVERMKLYKLVWDLVGSEFAGRHQQYEKFYAGASFVIRNYNYTHADWNAYHRVADGLLNSYDVPVPEAIAPEDARAGLS